jgi:hypothetical protein
MRNQSRYCEAQSSILANNVLLRCLFWTSICFVLMQFKVYQSKAHVSNVHYGFINSCNSKSPLPSVSLRCSPSTLEQDLELRVATPHPNNKPDPNSGASYEHGDKAYLYTGRQHHAVCGFSCSSAIAVLTIYNLSFRSGQADII